MSEQKTKTKKNKNVAKAIAQGLKEWIEKKAQQGEATPNAVGYYNRLRKVYN